MKQPTIIAALTALVLVLGACSTQGSTPPEAVQPPTPKAPFTECEDKPTGDIIAFCVSHSSSGGASTEPAKPKADCAASSNTSEDPTPELTFCITHSSKGGALADEPETVKTPVPQIDEITYKGTNSTPTISPEVEAEALALYNKLASEIVLRQEFYYTVVEDEEEFYDLTTTEVREVGNYQIVGTLSPATRVSGTFSNPALSLTVMDYNERTFTSTLVFSCLYKPSISRSQGTNTCSYHDFSE